MVNSLRRPGKATGAACGVKPVSATTDPGGSYGEIKVQKERRRHLRAPILVKRVTVGGKGNVFFGYAADISASGMFIGTVNPRRPGDKFTIRFTLPGATAEITVTAEVIWVREHDAKGQFQPGMGIKFLDIGEGDARAIREFVAEGRGTGT